MRIKTYKGVKDYSHYIEGIKENGKRKRLFFRSQREAELELKRRAKILRAEGEAGASLSLSFRIEAAAAAARLEPLGATLTDAVNFYVEHRKRIDASETLESVFNDYVQSQERAGLSQKHRNHVEYRLGRFVVEVGGGIKAVTVKMVDDWLNNLGLEPQTVNNYRSAIGGFFSFAEKRQLVDRNPVRAIAKRKLANLPPEIFTVTQLRELLAAADPDILPAIAIGAFAGLRNSEICSLIWDEVDQVRGFIEVKAAKAKSARRRLVPIEPNLREWLRPFAGMSGPVAPKSYYYALSLALQHAPSVHGWPQNGLRHSYASYWLAEHGDAGRLAGYLGHSGTAMIFSNYRQLVRPEQAHEYWRIAPGSPANVVAMAV